MVSLNSPDFEQCILTSYWNKEAVFVNKMIICTILGSFATNKAFPFSIEKGTVCLGRNIIWQCFQSRVSERNLKPLLYNAQALITKSEILINKVIQTSDTNPC